jgi:simple sugar transport system ATP-binding protein
MGGASTRYLQTSVQNRSLKTLFFADTALYNFFVESDSLNQTEPLLVATGVCKSFPGVKALDDVAFTARAGEVHALMGENGAGKSTLIKVLTGVYPKDSGKIVFAGANLRAASPLEAERAGIATVYQEVNLIPELSVAENIMLGRQPKKNGFLQWKEVNRQADEVLARLGLNIDAAASVSQYSMAIQQMVAIARALFVDARLLILDEPTSSLDEQEVAELFAVIRTLRDEGLGIIFVTHFLDQVYAVTDRITVLRNGALVGEYMTQDVPRIELIAHMLGKPSDAVEQAGYRGESGEASGNILLRAKGLGRTGAVQPLDFEILKGQVVGLAGLLGAGRTETARLLFGADKRSSGSVEMDGHAMTLHSPAQAIGEGIGFCSENRKSEGIIPTLSVRENIILALQAGRGLTRQLPRSKQREIAQHYIDALQVKTPSSDTPIEHLSGGNQQKVMLARWLCMQPKLLILDEPTRGIDVGAKGEIEKLVESLRSEGMALVFISSELEEVVRACSKVVVLRDHAKVGELSGAEVQEAEIMKLIAAS